MGTPDLMRTTLPPNMGASNGGGWERARGSKMQGQGERGMVSLVKLVVMEYDGGDMREAHP